METKPNGNVLEISLTGRIESSNSAEVERQIGEAVAQNPHKSVVINAEGLKYISSAGLRVLMKLQRGEEQKVSIINTSSDVYEIFNMTGFVKLMDVKKALRFVSVNGLELIGRGGNGCVYRLDADTMIKSFYNVKSVEDIDKGRQYAKEAFIHGIPTAISYETVKCEDGYGILFELLHAKPLSDVLTEDVEHREEYIDKYIDLLIQLHTTEVTDGTFHKLSDSLMPAIEVAKPYITAEEYRKLKEFLAWLPDRNTLVHGDFHTHNIMVQDTELILIDMDDVCVGHPVIELGGMLLAYYYLPKLATTDAVKNFLHLDAELSRHLWDRCVRRYFKTEDSAKIDKINEMLMPYMNFRKFTHSIVRPGDEAMMKRKIDSFRNEVMPYIDTMMANADFLKNMPAL